jgi:multidrug efflux pump subunit AcrA (membrane-fusion protein)
MIGRYTNTGIGVMDVEIIIDNPPEKLKPGFSFEGVIEVESEQSMLLVSQSAVTTKRGVSTVTKELEDGSTQTVTVQVKYLGENLYQILSGDVKDGDTVIYTRSEGGIAGLMNAMGGMGGDPRR